MDLQLTGKVALITGGNSGLGLATAFCFAREGAKVVIADIDAAGAGRQADALVAAGRDAAWVQVDLADEASVVAACAEVIAQHGTPWLLVNNAGLQHRELLLEGTAKFWDMTHAVNARGAFLISRQIARAMVGGGSGGRIVNCATTGLAGQLCHGHAAYLSSKGALAALTSAMALELAEHAITVNTVLPGGVGTPGSMGAEGPAPTGPGIRRPLLGFCEPRDIASAVLYFATPAARYVTNQTLAVDAGFSIC